MSANRCEDIAATLVDYADEELSARESSAIADHLAQCAGCRARLKALRRSLELVRVVWADSEMEAVGAAPASSVAEKRRRVAWLTRRRTALAAAVVALLIAGGLLWHSVGPGLQTAPRIVDAPVTLPSTSTSATGGPTPSDIEEQITRVGIAAQLLAAADVLAAQRGGEDIACERYRYIVAAYPGSGAATESGDRLLTFCDGRIGQ
jgi:predicted anti-sigma-YlaC factor YlaD